MASGLVAKKIALFELKPPNTEQTCRLKRKHAIRRKKYPRERKLSLSAISQRGSMLSGAASEEHLDLLNSASEVASSFSASCSALLDLIYNPEKSQPALERPESPVVKPFINIKDKRILCRSSSLEEAFPARLNIIDIDIEIRVEKKSRTPSPTDVYEATESNLIDKIKLTATMDSNGSHIRSSSNNSNNSNNSNRTNCHLKNTNIPSIPCTTTTNQLNTAHSPSCNYYCTNCGNYNTNSENLQEHIYENFSLVPPPRPPKRLFGDSLNSNCNYFGGSSGCGSTGGSYSDTSTKSKLSSVTFDNECSKTQSKTISEDLSNRSRRGKNDKNTEVKDDQKDEDEEQKKEHYYEDLYDYCNVTPDDEFCIDTIQPVAVTSFVSNDKDDEVEYCDCSTVMAMSINSLSNSNNSFNYEGLRTTGVGTNASVEYGRSSVTYGSGDKNDRKIFDEQIKTGGGGGDGAFGSREKSYFGAKMDFTKGPSPTFNLIGSRRSSLSSLIKGGVEYTGIFTNAKKSDKEIGNGVMAKSASSEKNDPVGRILSEVYGSGRYLMPRVVGETDVVPVINDLKDKKDEEDICKPLPPIPVTSSSSSSSSTDSFYSEPLYGITNQITNNNCNPLKNPGPPVPDTLRRPSLSPNPHSNIISCNNVIRAQPPQLSIFNKNRHSPSIASGSTYGFTESLADYADSVTNHNPNLTNSNFAPNDKLPPIPPSASKFSSIAKSAGRRIAKKFLNIRKTSRSSLENYDVPSSSSSTNGSVSGGGTRLSNPSPKTVSGASTPTGSVQGPQLRRPISRPSIPPPEPPKSVYGGSSNGSGNNYSIYEKSDTIKHSRKDDNEDDDFDDSDFYDSDSELIRNFVSQVQPIYSMEEEPLYQYYAYGISLKPDDDYQPVIPKNLGLTLDMLVPRVGQRTLWCELSEVISSGILSILSDKQKQLQEAIFEILTSEVSYLKSLDVLITVFYKNDELIGVLNEEERGYLFGNIEDVRDCAQSFLAELLAKWDESWYIQEIGEIINRNANTRFSVYKEYCRNKPYQDKAMQRLRNSRDEFVEVLKTLEEDSRCQMLRVDSFLMLPMQRITRLPLLVNAVIQRTISVKEKSHCEEALKSLTNLVLSCNEAARESQDAEETSAILDKLEYLRGTRVPSPLGQFIMKGDFMKNPFDQGRGNQLNWTFRKSKRTFYWLLLFANQLLITKRKANGRFEVLDMALPDDSTIKPLPNLEGVANDFQHFFMLHFNKKETVYFLAARTNSEIERWKSKLESMKTEKKLQVEAIFPYKADKADELTFSAGDIIEVSQMQPDGWYYGTKINGGQVGWFPGNYCCEV